MLLGWSCFLNRLPRTLLFWFRTVYHVVYPSIARDLLVRQIGLELDIPYQQINTRASFVGNGGDSLSAIKVVSACRANGIEVSVAMLLGSNTLDDVTPKLRSQKDITINFINRINGKRGVFPMREELKPLLLSEKRTRNHANCPATSMQMSMIHGSQTQAGRNVIRYYETYPTEQIPRVKSAWHAVVAMEPIFRTRFQPSKNGYSLVEDDQATFSWEEMSAANEMEAKWLLENYAFGTDFLGAHFRVVHLTTKQGTGTSTVIWNVHHALIDGFSSILILNKHRRALLDLEIHPGPSFIQLMSWIAAHRDQWYPGGDQFWANQLNHLKNSKSTLLVSQPSVAFNPHYKSHDILLGVDWKSLHNSAKGVGVTVASIFYAAWALTLTRYVDSRDVSFGVVLSGRSLPLIDSGNVIGPLINTLPFCVSLQPAESCLDYLRRVFQHLLDLDKFQWSTPEQGMPKMFDSIVNIHFEGALLEENPIGLLKQSHASIISALPLSLTIHLEGKVRLSYHEHVYGVNDVERLGDLFTAAVRALLNEDRTIRQCEEDMSSANLVALSKNGNFFSPSTFATAPLWDENLVDLFDIIAAKEPDAVAVEKGTSSVTYGQLHTMSLKLADHLASQVSPGEVVCVHADRSINWLVAIYAVLRANAVYCPLDAALPQDVREQNFCQCQSRVFVTGHTSALRFKPRTCNVSISVEDVLHGAASSLNPVLKNWQPSMLRRKIQPDHGAYLCFTSGSSGKPKGVLCSHRGLVAFQKDFQVRLRSKSKWRIGQLMSPAFDGSIHEIFSALSYGSTLVLSDSSDPFRHLQDVDVAILTPSIAQILDPHDFPRLSALYLVGESVTQEVCDKWAESVELFNMYGPSEATCGATIKQLFYRQKVTLGKPNPTTRIYVLDSERKLVPPGVMGEIYLAGVQTSLGYINNPTETTQRFLPDNILSRSGERMYKTGDRGYWNDSGDLCFCGRNDRQIKLRGFRIDLDDVEARIKNAVPGCVAVAVAYDSQHKILVAQIQPDGLLIPEVHATLSQTLPVYCVPRHIVAVSRFPQTAAGKLDYKSILSSREVSNQSLGLTDRSHKQDQLLQQVIEIWKRTLNLGHNESLHIDSDFMEMGGDSLRQLRLTRELSKGLGFPVPLANVLQSPRLGDMVHSLATMNPRNITSAERSPKIRKITPTEEEWFRKYEHNGGVPCHNVTALFKLGKGVDISKLVVAWNTVLGRYDILRSRYYRLRNICTRVPSKDCPLVEQMEQVDIARETNRRFNLQHDHLFRVMIDHSNLLIVAHHIICDYTSLEILLREVGSCYHGECLPIAKQYGEQSSTSEPPSPESVEYWRNQLRDLPSTNHSVGKWGSRNSLKGSSQIFKLPTATLHKIRQLTAGRGITAHQASLAAVALALQYHSDTIDVVLGAPYMARTNVEADKMVGLFLEPLPIHIRFDPLAAGDQSYLDVVRKASQQALCHALPWDMLLTLLNIQRREPDTPIFDVMVSYHDNFGTMGMPGIDAKPAYTWTEGSKFKLMVEFIVANDETLLVRLEHSHETFDQTSIARVTNLISSALALITNGTSLGAMQAALRTQDSLAHELRSSGDSAMEYFGARFEDM